MSRLNTFIIFVLGFLVLGFTVVGQDGLLRLWELKSELHELTRTKSDLDRRIADSRQELNQLKGSPEALEKRAREDLGYAREDEVIYVFPE